MQPAVMGMGDDAFEQRDAGRAEALVHGALRLYGDDLRSAAMSIAA